MKESKPKKIGIDGRVLQEKKPSGIPSYAYNIIKEISKIDKYNQYHIFYNSFRGIKKDIPEFGTNFHNHVFNFPNKILEWMWKIFPYPKIDKKLNVDIFFSPHFINIPLSQNTKKILTIHDISFEKNHKFFSWRKNLWHWQMNPKRMCHNFDKIISVTNSTKDDLVSNYKIDHDKIKTIYNGAQETKDHFMGLEKEFEILKKYEIKSKKYILFLATLEPRKNIGAVIDAFNLIKDKDDIRLVIAGKKGWLFKNIFKKVEGYGLREKIVFTDFVNEEEKNILFRNSLFFVFPSFYEGFGIPIIEAVNHKIPIITSCVSSIPEIIKDGAIMVNPHSINDLTRAMIELIQNQKTRIKLIEKESETKEFSWRESAKKTLDYILA